MITVTQSAFAFSNPPYNFSSAVTIGNTVFLVTFGYTTNGSNVTAGSVKLGGSIIPGTAAFFNSGGTNCINSASDGGNVAGLSFWMLPNIQIAGQTAVDFTMIANVLGGVIYEIAGMGTSPALDQSASNSSISSSSCTSGATGAITSAPELIIAGSTIFAGGAGPAAGFTTLGSGDMLAGYQIAASAGGAYTWTQTGSAGNPWAAGIVTVGPPPAMVTGDGSMNRQQRRPMVLI